MSNIVPCSRLRAHDSISSKWSSCRSEKRIHSESTKLPFRENEAWIMEWKVYTWKHHQVWVATEHETSLTFHIEINIEWTCDVNCEIKSRAVGMFGEVEHVWIANKMLRKFTLSVSTIKLVIFQFQNTSKLFRCTIWSAFFSAILRTLKLYVAPSNFRRN